MNVKNMINKYKLEEYKKDKNKLKNNIINLLLEFTNKYNVEIKELNMNNNIHINDFGEKFVKYSISIYTDL